VAWIRERFFRSVDVVVTAGPASTEAVLAMGVPRERIVEGFNAVDVQWFHSAATRARTVLGPRPGHHVLYVGQLIERKNIEAALHAFAQVAQATDTFTIVGTGRLRDRLEAVATTLGLADRTVFAGHLEGGELAAAYAAAQTFVLPSTEEVWGLVVNEALACGLHAVVSAAAGVASSVTGMPGVFVAEPSIGALAEALAASRSAWTSPIPQPEILQHTPQALATAFDRACDRALQLNAGSG
jgi:glycosyltransferase involved in cell wall biosynthesis